MALTIIGVTEAGVSALAQDAQSLITGADAIIAAPRFHDGIRALQDTAKVTAFPSPFSDIYDHIASLGDAEIVVLATGDPLWFGVGASLLKRFGADNCRIIPGVSGFQMVAARMGWPLAGCETVTVHGRPSSAIMTRLYPRARLLIIGQDETTPAQIAALLCASGYDAATVTILASVGGDEERRFDFTAGEVGDQVFPPFHIIAVACPANIRHDGGAALPDAAFENDGKLTKRDVRASALAKLAPFPGAVMWDVGAGSGAVAIDFLRNAPRGRAIAIDRNDDQLAMATRNAARHGAVGLKTEKLDLSGSLSGLDELPQPDAIFIGGGVSPAVVAACQKAVRVGGVIVAHAVTLESEAVLMDVWQKTGGAMTRLSVHHADSVGAFHGWRPLMPVTQLVWHKESNEGPDAEG